MRISYSAKTPSEAALISRISVLRRWASRRRAASNRSLAALAAAKRACFSLRFAWNRAICWRAIASLLSSLFMFRFPSLSLYHAPRDCQPGNLIIHIKTTNTSNAIIMRLKNTAALRRQDFGKLVSTSGRNARTGVTTKAIACIMMFMFCSPLLLTVYHAPRDCQTNFQES